MGLIRPPLADQNFPASFQNCGNHGRHPVILTESLPS
jgi:hypothetical protein